MEIKEMELDDKQFLEAVKTANLSDNLAKYTAKIADQRVTEGVKSYEANRNKKDLSDKERLLEVEKELSELKASKTKDNLASQIKAELKKQNLSEGLIKYITINDPEKIAESVENLKNDLLETRQAIIDEKLKEGGSPLKGDTLPGTSIPTAVKAYAEKISVKEK